MKLILSGEGSSDLGTYILTENGNVFKPGPMAWIVDKLLENYHTSYSLLDNHSIGGNCVIYVDKGQLAAFSKKGTTTSLPGFKHGRGNLFFASNAQSLGLYAKKVSENEPDIAIIAVLFRDGDGTNSKKEWNLKLESIRHGFVQVKFLTGVPMVPNPKSEAWMICALRNPPYTDCASIEDESGNDKSPQALKDQLKSLCGGSHISAEDQANWVKEGKVDPVRIDMPSFSMFKEDLQKAAQNAGFPTR